MIENVAIIGAGQLGRRHFEAVLKAPTVRFVHLVDPFPAALQAAAASASVPGIRVTAVSHVRELPAQLDFVVVATNSLERRKVVEDLLASCSVKRLLLEKFLFPRLEDYGAVLALLKAHGARAWVNFPRRLYQFYRDLKTRLTPGESVSMNVSASKIFVGTHAVHFLDLFSFLTGQTRFDAVDMGGLDRRIYETKRPGYIEFHGTVTARVGGSTFVFQKIEREGFPLQVSIVSGAGRYTVLENEGVAYQCHGLADEKWEAIPFPKPPQSDLTHVVVSQLAVRGDCDLTGLPEASLIHSAMLDSLLKHMRDELGTPTDICRIT